MLLFFAMDLFSGGQIRSEEQQLYSEKLYFSEK